MTSKQMDKEQKAFEERQLEREVKLDSKVRSEKRWMVFWGFVFTLCAVASILVDSWLIAIYDILFLALILTLHGKSIIILNYQNITDDLLDLLGMYQLVTEPPKKKGVKK